jgi:hypothetical protein
MCRLYKSALSPKHVGSNSEGARTWPSLFLTVDTKTKARNAFYVNQGGFYDY